MDSSARNYSFAEPMRKEIINGNVYMMAGASRAHNDILQNLTFILQRFLKGKTCKLYGENFAVYFDERSPQVLPDIKIICDRSKIRDDKIYGAPDFIVEILSNSTKKKDLTEKKDLYERSGVREYWIISPAEKSIQVYILQNGKYDLDYIYHDFDEEYIENKMKYGSDEQKEMVKVRTIKTSLYGDEMIISISEIFEDMF